jgi:hypothetical protein
MHLPLICTDNTDQNQLLCSCIYRANLISPYQCHQCSSVVKIAFLGKAARDFLISQAAGGLDLLQNGPRCSFCTGMVSTSGCQCLPSPKVYALCCLVVDGNPIQWITSTAESRFRLVKHDQGQHAAPDGELEYLMKAGETEPYLEIRSIQSTLQWR